MDEVLEFLSIAPLDANMDALYIGIFIMLLVIAFFLGVDHAQNNPAYIENKILNAVNGRADEIHYLLKSALDGGRESYNAQTERLNHISACIGEIPDRIAFTLLKHEMKKKTKRSR